MAEEPADELEDLFEDMSQSDFQSLVTRNGLTKLFANRTRARILITLAYADERLSVKEIANGANISQTAVHEAMEQLEQFDIAEKYTEPGTQEEYRIDRDDQLVQEILTVAETATERYFED